MSRNRVVLQLTDASKSEDYERTLQFNKSFRGVKKRLIAEIKMIDDCTLSLSTNNCPNDARGERFLEFHCVAQTNDPRLRNEYTRVMDELIHDNQKSAVLVFTTGAECRSSFLSQLLVMEVDKRIKDMRGMMHSIILECSDLKKYEVVNQLMYVKINKGLSTSRIKPASTQKEFVNTAELHKWLQFHYVDYWTKGLGHQCVDVEYCYSDSGFNKCTANISLMFFYLNRMDNDTKSMLCTFFHHMQNPKPPAKSMLITDCIKEFFARGENPWHSLLVFEVPLINTREIILTDALRLASAAYNGIQRIWGKEKEGSCFDFLRSGSSLIHTTTYLPAESSHASKVSNASKQNLAKSNSKAITKNKLYQPIEFFTLSSWYCKIDDECANLQRLMEEYYEQAYDNKVTKICNDLLNVKDAVEQIFAVSKQLRHPRSALRITAGAEQLANSYSQYMSAVSTFQKLSKEIERAPNRIMLRAYIEKRGRELRDRAQCCKELHLRNCASRIIKTIKDELKTCKSDTTLKTRKNLVARSVSSRETQDLQRANTYENNQKIIDNSSNKNKKNIKQDKGKIAKRKPLVRTNKDNRNKKKKEDNTGRTDKPEKRKSVLMVDKYTETAKPLRQRSKLGTIAE